MVAINNHAAYSSLSVYSNEVTPTHLTGSRQLTPRLCPILHIVRYAGQLPTSEGIITK